jgi:hypothetical protein
MAGANSNIQLTDLDFNTIKNNLKTYLQSQDTLKDYNYEGSALSVLLDVLAYNTQYNAYYLNMVANEMFLDTALQRSSVVSQAKLMNYVPKSAIAPTAIINLNINQVSDPTLTLPKFTPFMSEAIDGINYTFVTTDSYTSTVDLGTNRATFTNVVLKQGIPASISYTVNSTTNPKYNFILPTENIDTTTLQVLVQQSTTNTAVEIYKAAENYLTLDGNSLVYFLQENVSGSYNVSFGDGILGKKLTDGNIVLISYITTSGSDSYGANNFVLMGSVGGYSSATITPVSSTTKGTLRESIDSIKYQAPKSYSSQKRAVTKEDYITVIQQNNLGYSFDAVNVWGGQENDPPVYGQVFVAIKPSGAYVLSATQKERLIADVIRPVSILTVEPTIVDPDYTYLQLTSNVYYDPRKTNLTASQIKEAVKTTISNLASTSLNTFNSTFSITDFTKAISSVSTSIITNEMTLQLQKKFIPNLSISSTYNLYYGSPLKRGMFQSGLTTSPYLSYRNPLNLAQLITGVYIEEIPSSTGGIDSISVLNPGFGYQSAPTVKILGDGTGATAEAIITGDGSIKSITVLTPGTGYTSAIVSITPAEGTSTGALGAATAILEGRYGTLRTYYYDSTNVKVVFENNIGTIDYNLGIVTLNSFNPIDVDNPLGQLTITANPTSTIISSTYNRIITIDPFDPNAIIVNVTAKST